MVDLYLVTTADESTWPHDKPIVFLGEWCKVNSRKIYWDKLQSETVDYHWDSSLKMKTDYIFLQQVYEELLIEISDHLNSVHGVKHSLRYWRIIIGPWLGSFIHILFDRLSMLKIAINKYDITSCKVHSKKLDNFIPNDMAEYAEFSKSDSWNEFIYGQLLFENFDIDIELVQDKEKEKIIYKDYYKNKSYFQRCKLILINFYIKISLFFYRDNEHFFLSTYLPFIIDFNLQFKLGQIPKIWKSFKPISVAANKSNRQDIKISKSKDFKSIAHNMALLHIPIVYLEGYKNILDQTQKLSWPVAPKTIFTSISFYADDLFKVWAAEKCSSGSSLIIGQHGGTYSSASWSFMEDHQISIADKWLSWGQGNENFQNVFQMFNFKLKKKKLRYNVNGKALLLGLSNSRYSSHMCAIPSSSQCLSHLNDQFNFVSSLPSKIQKKIEVRTPFYEQWPEWEEIDRWKENFPDISISTTSQKSFIKNLMQCRISISTYNATTFLETLSLNFPTIIFWDEEFSSISLDAKKFFSALESVGIFHKSPQSAAQKIIDIWDDIPAWWNSSDVQKVRRQFCNQYSKLSNSPVEDLLNVFNS